MATNTVGLNQVFPIYNEDETPFHNLVLRRGVVDSVVMSLGDKITGDVYYQDNTLEFTMKEYVVYKDVHYSLINPPTIVREGMATDNGELKGMTKYSFEFYHPMCQLSNFPFTDVATKTGEEKYLSQNKSFSWIGKPQDYIDKLNKNLQGTVWYVRKSGFPVEKDNELSDVLTFDNVTVADAIKTGYETWDIPYVVSQLPSTDPLYAQGKRFVVEYGLPSNEIYESGSSTPFVFQMGKGVGLKNNSRTPRNNKIITRISGSGSESNIPYGYPQIIWYGNQDWDYTINNNPNDPNSYPIYKGIVGGQYVKLIKHPFTRTNLMPSIYSQTVFNKVSPYMPREIHACPEYSATLTEELVFIDGIIAESTGSFKLVMQQLRAVMIEVATHTSAYTITIDTEQADGIVRMDDRLLMSGYVHDKQGGREFEFEDIYNDSHDDPIVANANYDPTTTLIDYYDADVTYPNPIVADAPSYESHEFEDIKPEFDSSESMGIVSAIPLNADLTPADHWDDSMDDDGNYLQSYFQITLQQLSFDLYACAAITQEMQINMRSGACIGCTFNVQVDWDDYKANFYDSDGNFVPDGAQRDLTKYPKSNLGQISVVVQKDNSTFGTLMPNIYQQPKANDLFVFIGISLPLSYIANAEERLDDAMKTYMLENNVFYFDYPLKFDEHFLASNTQILEQIRPNSIIHFDYGGVEQQLFVKQLTVKYGNAPLPQYDITLTDNIEVVLNQIGQVADDVEKLSSLIAILRQTYNRNVWNELAKKLSKTQDDTAQGFIRFMQGLQVGNQFVSGILGEGGVFRKDADGKTYIEADKMYVRMKAYFDSVEIREYQHTSGNRIASPAQGFKCSRVDWLDANGNVLEQTNSNLPNVEKFRCYWRVDDGETKTDNQFVIGDLAFCQNAKVTNTSLNTKRFWRVVVDRDNGNDYNSTDPHSLTEEGEAWIDISNAHNSDSTPKMTTITWVGQGGITQSMSVLSFWSGSDIPSAEDNICMLGDVRDTTRQGAIIEYTSGEDSPSYKIYQGIGSDPTNPYSLEDKNYLSLGYNSATGHAYLMVYGDMYIGARPNEEGGFIRYNQDDRTLDVKGRLNVGSTLADGRNVNALGTSNGNLLLNTSFTGDYDSEDVDTNTDVTPDTVIYSDPLRHWNASDVIIVESSESQSGYAAKIMSGGNLSQEVTLEEGKWYVLSFRGKGGALTYSIGGVSGSLTLKDFVDSYDVPFVCGENVGLTISASSDVTLMELQLCEGNLPTEWTQNYRDGEKSMASVNEYKYIRDAIENGSTNILGGLILSQILKVGNYRNKTMSQETGGMSGIFTSNNSPFLWGGGTMSQAIYTIMKYANDPSYQASDEEVANMSNFVVTHGGRAILNDIILRGYVYALGGSFRGYINAEGGNITGAVKIGEDGGKRVLVLDPHSISGQPNSPALYGKIQNETRFALSLLRELGSSFSEHANIKMNGYDGNDVITESEFSDDRFHLKYEVNDPDPSLMGKDFTFDIAYDNGIVFTIKKKNFDTAKEDTITIKLPYDGRIEMRFVDGDGGCLIPPSPSGLLVGSIYHDNGTLKVVI